ncbi:MAG: autotransporter domain-containing protein, partial [Fusobacterium necrophorum]|nr:autotransporter domain-containing protein [Fusobacterium necrophorum]
MGGNSIGIQIYAPGNINGINAPKVTVKNNLYKEIILGGVASYGLKVSSRINQNSTIFNEGSISIKGDNTASYDLDDNPSTAPTGLFNGNNNSLSSGIAILEDSTLTNASAIRAYKDKVKNIGTINVSGGQGNTGMVLITKANDNITNDTTGTINVTGTKNIGMRVDLGNVTTEESGTLTPEAINKGTINITAGDQNIGMVANKKDISGNKAVAMNTNSIRFFGEASKAIGMFASNGGEIVNNKDIKYDTTDLLETIGVVVNDKDSIGKNTGDISLNGTRVTGVYNRGSFEMTDGSITTSGAKSISLYSSGVNSKTEIKNGKIRAEGGALGLFADNNATVQLGDSADVNKKVVLEADGAGTLLFYNYTKSGTTYTSDGKFKINNENVVTGKLINGATAFYFKDTTPGKGSGQTSDKLNAMFNGSNNNKIKLELDDKSTLFVLDNTNPNTDYIPLSSVDINSINDFLGKNVEINTSLSSRNFKAYKATKASLSINSDIDLDNHSSTTIDKYYRVDFMNSNVRVETGKKITGSDSSIRDIAIAQANFDSATRNDSVKVTNKGNIEFSKKGATGIVVDYAQGINEGTIKMDAANSTGENSIAMFGASGSKLENTTNGTIELGTNGVGIWGANKISSSILTWSKNIDIANAGKIKGINGKSGIFGIYANNDITTHSGATSILSHSGTIDLSQNIKSTGIFMKNGILTSTGNIFVKEASVAVNATDSTVNVSGGTYIVGKESLGFKLTATSSGTLPVFNGIGGNISMTESGSVAYLLEGGTYNSGLGNNFIDNLALTSTNGYTYINVKNATLNYRNTKAINNDETIFVNSNATILELMNGTNLSSTKQKVTGIYATNGGSVDNAGKITLIGDNSSAMYATKDTITNVSTSLKNKNTGNIEVGKNGSAMYAIGSNAENEGMMTVGSGSVGMRTEGGILQNKLSGSISSTGVKVLGMSQSTGGNITNEGVITLTGDQSIGMQSEKATISGHEIKNTGSITVGDSSSATTPSIGIYSANDINSKIINSKKVIAGNKSIGIYGKEIELGANSETSAGDAGIAVYSNKGLVTIQNVAKLKIGKSLGENQEGVAVYLAGDAQNLESKTSTVTIGNGSFGYVMTGQGNTITTGLLGNTEVISLGKDSMFLYSADKTGSITNYNHLKSIGDKNYGLYVSGAAENKGNIDFSVGIGNVGIYSYLKGAIAGTKPGLVQNYGEIKVSKSDISDPNHRKYGIGMAAGFTEEEPIGSGTKVLRGTGNIKNEVGGVIKVTDENSIGMYATGKGSVAENAGRIELSGNNRNIGMFIEEGAEGINTGTITTVGSGNKKQIGIAVMSGGILDNRGNIHIDAEDGYGILLAGAIIKNYGTFEITPEKYAEDKAGVENVLNFNQITAGSGAQKLKIIGATDMTKEMGDMGLDKIKIDAPAGIANATITVNGVVQKPVIADVQAIPNRVPNKIPTSSVGMYVDTSGINYTKPITNIGKLVGLTEADLIIGTEATNYTNGKYIQLSQEMIEPYNDVIRTSGIEKWSIYSGALTWMASITQLPDFSIRNAYLAKIPYTVFANDKNTTRDIYNFADGLEQRYGVEKIGARENQLFQKLNRIGNNEEILLHQAYDEMMGHQYANVQQRIQATSSILDKELKYLKKEWDTKSKDSNKIKAFGMQGEYKTNTAGVMDYSSHAQGVA